MDGTLLVDFITSLDGYGAAEGWPGWWGLEGPEYLAWLAAQPEGDWPIVMGANTYRAMAGFAASGEPGTEQLADTTKYLVSSTLLEPFAWRNTVLIDKEPLMAIRDLLEDGVNLRTIGSLQLCRALLEEGLVSRFRVGIFPVITGATGQERIYDGYPDVTLELIEARTLDNRIQILEYRPTILDAPPSAG